MNKFSSPPPAQTRMVDDRGLITLPWLMYFQQAELSFTDRGDPTAADLTQATLTKDSAWHDWDLSAIVPAGATAVLIRVLAVNTAAIGTLMFRKNGNANAINVARVDTQTTSGFVTADIVVPCDSGRMIEYYVGNVGTWAAISLTVAGWWK